MFGESNIVGTGEAAKLLGVSRARVLELLRTKRINGFKVGRFWVLSLEDVRGYEASRRGPGRPAASKG